MPASDTIVRRLRVRGHTADGLQLRRRATAVIAGAELHGPSLHRASILCIRKMSDPLPRSLGLADRRVRPTAAWESAARKKISMLADRAVRPALGAVPASAEAVLFLDRAELLACLAADWTDGRLVSCWWWRALFGAMDVAEVVRAWRESPEHVPAACHLLATWRRLDRFVQQLPGVDCAALTRDVARTFGLDAVGRAAGAHWTERHHTPDPADTAKALGAPHETAIAAARDRACWTRYVPELTPAAMAPEPRLLVLTTLVVHRSPSAARRILSPQLVDAIVTGETTSPSERLRPAELGSAGAPRHDSRADAGERSHAPVESGAADELCTEDPARHESVRDAAPTERESEAADATKPAEPATAPAARPVTDVVETQFGGAFLLINVGIALGLYSDFTSPTSPGIDLPIWDFIVLVTERLLDDERLENDPLVPFLARLAGRDPYERPGMGFVPDDAETLEGWLDSLVPRLRSRVAAALAVPEDAAASLTLRRAARVSLSPSHLDISFALNDLPIQIRLAGLDRDPGFVPAAGLTITFSYV